MSQALGANSAPFVDSDFVALVRLWMQNPAGKFLNFVWLAYEDMIASPPHVDTRDLERSITQLLEPRIRDRMTGYEPFYIQHGPFERETMKPPPAQPPEYDLAFVSRADERIMWPIEAKVLKTTGQVSDYIRDVREEFLTCRYAPFSRSGAMLGYLLTGIPDDVFVTIAQRLGCKLEKVVGHTEKPIRLSKHKRDVPAGKPYPSGFNCYHMILEYPDLS